MSCNICGRSDHQDTTAGCPDNPPGGLERSRAATGFVCEHSNLVAQSWHTVPGRFASDTITTVTVWFCPKCQASVSPR